jgi:hypothetical protein
MQVQAMLSRLHPGLLQLPLLLMLLLQLLLDCFPNTRWLLTLLLLLLPHSENMQRRPGQQQSTH